MVGKGRSGRQAKTGRKNKDLGTEELDSDSLPFSFLTHKIYLKTVTSFFTWVCQLDIKLKMLIKPLQKS